MLAELVGPLLSPWIKNRQIDRFFFIRYALGGPHLRLRLRLEQGVSSQDLGHELTERASNFFQRYPSMESWSESKIRQTDAKLLADSEVVLTESDLEGTVPDERVVPAPYLPEIDRYGGAERLGPNHDFFTLSSAIALHTLHGYSASDGRRPSRIRLLPLLLAQTVGGSATAAEARSIIRYPPAEAWKAFAPVVNKAEALFDRDHGAFAELISETVTRMNLPETAEGKLARGAGYLARLCEDSKTRRRVLCSQLHMTANRLGLSNAEEVYLSHIATRCFDRFSTSFTEVPQTDLPPTEAPRLLGELVESCLMPLLHRSD